jgi:hypothetical protein
LDDLTGILGRELEVRVAEKAQLDLFIARYYGDDKPAA